MGRAGAEDRLVIVEPLRQRHGFELRRRHPGDGRGTVGPHNHNLPRPVHNLQHGLLGDGIAGLNKEVIELHFGGGDLCKPPGLKEGGKLALHLTAGAALGKKSVPGALRRIDDGFHWGLPFSLSLYHATILYSRAAVKGGGTGKQIQVN